MKVNPHSSRPLRVAAGLVLAAGATLVGQAQMVSVPTGFGNPAGAGFTPSAMTGMGLGFNPWRRGIRYVTVPTPMWYHPVIARNFFAAGGLNLLGTAPAPPAAPMAAPPVFTTGTAYRYAPRAFTAPPAPPPVTPAKTR